jgi:hypothetical protein
MRSSLSLLSAAILLLAPVAAAHADPVTYTLTGVMSGSLNGVAFINATVTFTETADTSTAFAYEPYIYGNTDGSSTVSVSGFGTATLTDPYFGALAQSQPMSSDITGFFDIDTSFGLGPVNTGFDGYDLTTSIGPLSGPLAYNPGTFEATTLGALTITSYGGPSTFTATVTPPPPPPPPPPPAVPEPSSIYLLGTGVLGIAGAARKKFRRA